MCSAIAIFAFFACILQVHVVFGAPAGMIAWFNATTCPLGWWPAPFDSYGRLVMGDPGGNRKYSTLLQQVVMRLQCMTIHTISQQNNLLHNNKHTCTKVKHLLIQEARMDCLCVTWKTGSTATLAKSLSSTQLGWVQKHTPAYMHAHILHTPPPTRMHAHTHTKAAPMKISFYNTGINDNGTWLAGFQSPTGITAFGNNTPTDTCTHTTLYAYTYVF